MSDQTNGEAKRLTLEDPVAPEVIQGFQQIQTAQQDLAMEFLALEDRKIQILAANKKLREQHQRLFESILIERGCPANMPAELDAKTGKILLKQQPAPAPEPS